MPQDSSVKIRGNPWPTGSAVHPALVFAVVFVAIVGAEEFGKTRDQVHLCEHHVDGRENFEFFGELLHALAQIFRQIDGEFRAIAGEFRNARRHDDAVDRCFRTIALQ